MVKKKKGVQDRSWAEASRKATAETENFLCGVDEITPDSSETLSNNIWTFHRC